MARTVAPLLSFDARGAIAKTQVYSNWKGIPYVRRYTVPSNPQTAEQDLTRNTFRWLNNVWKFMPSASTAAWAAYADSNRFTDRNGFIKQNNGPLRTETDLTLMVLSPSAKSGIVAAGIVTTPGANSITVDITAPALPTGWTIAKGVAAAIRDQDPQTEAFYTVTAGEDATSTYQVVLSGLTSAVSYLVGAWFVFNRPDGSLAYGQSLQEFETPS